MPTKLNEENLLGEAEKILIYGEYGTGKTELWATAPEPIYALIVGPRNELKTLQSPGFKARHGERDITYDFVQEEFSNRGVFKTASAFDKACDHLDTALKLRDKGDLPFKTLVIENTTTLLNVQTNKVLEIGRGSRENKALSKLRDQNILFLSDGDYGGVQSLMRQLVNWVYNLPVHTILVAHEKVESNMNRETRQQTITRVSPNFIGQQRTEIPGLFDNVWRTTVEGSGRSALFRVNTVGDDVIACKTRVGGVLKEKELNLDISAAIEKMTKGVKK